MEMWMKRKVQFEKSLAFCNPELAKEWSDNNPFGPEEISFGSGKEVLWVCKEGHEYPARIDNRKNNGTRCPYCSGRKAIPGKTDLMTRYPDIAKELHPTKNGNIDPRTIACNSHTQYIWTCKNGHDFPARVYHRIKEKGGGCPYCSGRKAISGETDLFTRFPELKKEYDFEKNKGIDIDCLSAYSHGSVFWICPKGHSYPARISDRTQNGSGCPFCAGKRAIPNETNLFYLYPKLKEMWDYDSNTGLDSDELTAGSNRKVVWKCEKGHRFPRIIEDMIKSSNCPFCSKKLAIPNETDILTEHPEVIPWIDFDNNEWIDFSHIRSGSGLNIKWKCPQGHTFNDEIYAFVERGRRCPYCSGRRKTPENGLMAKYPEIAKRMIGRTDEEKKIIAPHSHTYYKWICDVGHIYDRSVDNEVSGNKCPFCLKRKPIPYEYDLLTINPQLASELYEPLNNGIDATKLTPKSGRKVYWKCDNGHVYRASVANRANGKNCKECYRLGLL